MILQDAIRKEFGLTVPFTKKELSDAYRRRCRELHPDVNKSPNATKQFQEMSEIYQNTLKAFDTINRIQSNTTPIPPNNIRGARPSGAYMDDVYDTIFGRGAYQRDHTTSNSVNNDAELWYDAEHGVGAYNAQKIRWGARFVNEARAAYTDFLRRNPDWKSKKQTNYQTEQQRDKERKAEELRRQRERIEQAEKAAKEPKKNSDFGDAFTYRVDFSFFRDEWFKKYQNLVEEAMKANETASSAYAGTHTGFESAEERIRATHEANRREQMFREQQSRSTDRMKHIKNNLRRIPDGGTCPLCEGHRVVEAIGLDSKITVVQCGICNGSGVIDAQTARDLSHKLR